MRKNFFKCLTFLTDFDVDLNIFSLFAFGISKSDLIVSIEVTRSFCRFKAGGNFFVPRAFAEQHTVSRRATNSRNTEFIVPRFVLFTTFYGREIENDETMTYKKRILDLTFCSVTNDYIMINKNSTILSTEIFLYLFYFFLIFLHWVYRVRSTILVYKYFNGYKKLSIYILKSSTNGRFSAR